MCLPQSKICIYKLTDEFAISLNAIFTLCDRDSCFDVKLNVLCKRFVY